MASKLIVLCATLAAANAGIIGAPAQLAYSAGPAVYSSLSSPIVTKAIASPAYAYSSPAVAAYSSPLAHAPVAYSSVGYAPSHGSYGSTHENTFRTLDGSSSSSHFSKAVDSAYSSVRKYDTRITNDAKYAVASPVLSTYAHAPVAYSAPIAHAPLAYAAQASPLAYAAHSTPLAYSAPIAHAPLAYSSPIAHAPLAYSSPIAHAPLAYSSPIAHAPLAYSSPAVVKSAVAYSPAAVVSHVSYSGLGANYAW